MNENYFDTLDDSAFEDAELIPVDDTSDDDFRDTDSDSHQSDNDTTAPSNNSTTVQTGNSADSAPTEQEFDMVYNGATVKKSLSEMKTLAQKGMNYEKAIERAKIQNPYYDAIAKYAKMNGQSVDEYLSFINRHAEEQEVRELENDGVPSDVAKELAGYRAEKKLAEEAAARQKEEAERLKPFQELLKAYPDLKKLPPEVEKAINMGEHPVSAMRAYELEQLKNEMAALRAASKNRSTSPSPLSTSGDIESDDFLDGFYGKD